MGDAREDVDQHAPDLGAFRDLLHGPDQAPGIAAERAGTDVAEIVGADALFPHLVDELHRQPGAGRHEADLAVRVELHVVEVLSELERGLRVGRRAGANKIGEQLLTNESVLVGDHLGIARQPGAVGGDEHRVDLDLGQFEPAEDTGEEAASLRQRTGHVRGKPVGKPGDRGCDGVRIARGAIGPERRAALCALDLHAAGARQEHVDAARRGIDRQAQIGLFGLADRSFDAALADRVALETPAQQSPERVADFLSCLGADDAARLAAPACRNLHLDEPRPIEVGQVVGRRCERPAGHRHALGGQNLLGIVFQNQHFRRNLVSVACT